MSEISLVEITIIDLLKRIDREELSLESIHNKIPQSIYDLVAMCMDPLNAFGKLVQDNKLQLANYIFNKLTEMQRISITKQSALEQGERGNFKGIKYLLQLKTKSGSYFSSVPTAAIEGAAKANRVDLLDFIHQQYQVNIAIMNEAAKAAQLELLHYTHLDAEELTDRLELINSAEYNIEDLLNYTHLDAKELTDRFELINSAEYNIEELVKGAVLGKNKERGCFG